MAKLENFISLRDGVSPALQKITFSARNAQNKMYNFKTAVTGAGAAAETASVSLGKIFTGNLLANVAISAVNRLKESLMGFISVSESYSQVQGRLAIITKTQGEAAKLNDMIYESAQRARGGYLDMAQSVAKLSLNAKDAFPDPKEAVGFVEGVQKLFTASGASKNEQKNAMLQLTQALGSGRLQGDEFRSISENAPELLNLISKELGVTRAKVRELATEGKLTPEIIKNAVMHNMDTIDKMLDKMPKTWGDHWQSISNAAIKAFVPIFDEMKSLANSDSVRELVKNIVGAIKGFVPIFYGLVKVVKGAFEIIKNIVVGVSNFIRQHSLLIELALKSAGLAFLYVGTLAAIAMSKTIAQMAIATVETMLKVAADIAETGAIIALTIAQEGFNAALYACPLTWIIGLIFVFVGIIYGAVAAINYFTGANISATGIIAGAFAWLFAMIANGIIFAINNFIAFANFLMNVFQDPLNAAYNLFVDIWNGIVDFVAQAVNGIIDLVNEIPGMKKIQVFGHVEASGLERKVLKGANYHINSMAYFDAGSMMQSAYNRGASIGNMFSMPDMKSLYNEKDEAEKDETMQDIADNTGKGAKAGERAADALESTVDDLKYLREAMQNEATNKYTTTIHVDAGGLHITNADERDYDGIFREFCNRVVESMENGAEGALR